jgi:hypothetical protein
MQLFEVCLKGGKDLSLSLIMVENEVQLDIQLL